MHKCIMVKDLRGKQKTNKVCKKQVNLPKTGRKIFKSRGERIIFWEKVKFGKFSTESEMFRKQGRNLKQGKMYHCHRGDERP